MSRQNQRSATRRAARLSDSQAGAMRLTESGIIRIRREQLRAEPSPSELGNDPAVRNYVVLCLGSMIALLAALVLQGMGTSSLIPVLIGIMGVVTRWRAAPILVILSHSALYYVEMLGIYLTQQIEVFPDVKVGDLLMAAAILCYTAGHYRLQGLIREILPREAQRPSRRMIREHVGSTELPPRRSTAAVPPGEIGNVAPLTAWVAAALLVWVFLLVPSPRLVGYYDVRITRAFLLVWIVGVGLLVAGSLLRYLSARYLGRQEAMLWLQDQFWRETHREQRSVNRWRAWTRLRQHKKQGTSS